MKGNKGLSGYFQVEISLVPEVLKNYYLEVKQDSVQLTLLQHNPFRTSGPFHCVIFRILSTTIPPKERTENRPENFEAFFTKHETGDTLIISTM